MARIEFGNFGRSMNPAWMGDYFDRAHLIPGGAKLNTASFAESGGVRFVASGTVVGRTYAERADGVGFKPVTTDGEPAAVEQDEVYIVAYDVQDANIDNDVDLYRHGGIVKETLLPGWGDLNAAVQTLIRELYTTTVPVSHPVD